MTGLRRIPDLWQRWDVTVRDIPLALVLVLASLVPALHSRGTQLGDLPTRPMDALAVAAVALELARGRRANPVATRKATAR